VAISRSSFFFHKASVTLILTDTIITWNGQGFGALANSH
jgi:hypothetical protein